jgi:galactose mutarotase-like enzyme
VTAIQTEVSSDGFNIIHLSNPKLSMSILPQLGGKISGIVDLRTGRDWLWKNSHIAFRHPTPNMDYERDLDSGGWDEILFSVKPSKLEMSDGSHLSIGDHGLLVDKPWREIDTSINEAGQVVCEMLATGVSPHFSLSRNIILDAEQPVFEMQYKLTNTGQSTWPWFWCAHPLLAIQPGMHINLKKDQPIRPVRNGITQTDTDQYWPNLISEDGTRVDLESIFEKTSEPETYCQKLYVRSDGKICLSTADDNEIFCISYDPEKLPWLGLWVNKNGWSGCDSEPYLNLGMEPSSSSHDTLAGAIGSDQVNLVQPGKSISWSLSISLLKGQTHD